MRVLLGSVLALEQANTSTLMAVSCNTVDLELRELKCLRGAQVDLIGLNQNFPGV